MKTDPTFWLLARASGLTAYVLLTASVLAGLVAQVAAVRSRAEARADHATSTASSRCSGSGCSRCTASTLTLDRTMHMPLAGLVVPGLSPYRPGVGRARRRRVRARGADRTSPSPLRRRIGARNWRRLHWATYLVFLMATVHGFAAGHRLDAAVGSRPLPRGGRRRRLRHGVARARPSHPLPAPERST